MEGYGGIAARVVSWWASVRAVLVVDAETAARVRETSLRRVHTASAIAAPMHIAHLGVFLFLEPETPDEARWRSGILLAHLLLLVLMVAANRLTTEQQREHDGPVQRGLPWVALAVLLIAGVAIAGIDQLVTTSITPYLVVSVIAALVLLLPPQRSLLVYVGGFVLFTVAMSVMQPDPSVRTSNIVNGLTAVALSLILTVLQWRAEVRDVRQARRIALQQDELAARNAELERLATYDGLTGLINRRQFEVLVDDELAQMRRYRTPAAILVVDADGFKAVNDHHGHPVGDRLLQELATLLRARLRESDLLSRWGGDEFLALLPRTDESGARVIAEELCSTVRDTHLGVGDLVVTISIGVALLEPFSPIPLEEAYREADVALYRAKHDGGDRVAVASSQLGDPVRES